jgi:hypothetical protein
MMVARAEIKLRFGLLVADFVEEVGELAVREGIGIRRA